MIDVDLSNFGKISGNRPIRVRRKRLLSQFHFLENFKTLIVLWCLIIRFEIIYHKIIFFVGFFFKECFHISILISFFCSKISLTTHTVEKYIVIWNKPFWLALETEFWFRVIFCNLQYIFNKFLAICWTN